MIEFLEFGYFSYEWNNGEGPKESENIFLRDLMTRIEGQEIQHWGVGTSISSSLFF